MVFYAAAAAAGLAFLWMIEGLGGVLLLFSLVVLGIYLLVKGADYLVEGAVAIAERVGVSKLFIGLSLVAFGTSAPELAVSITSAVKGVGGVAISNVVGSNIANIALCFGLTVLFVGSVKVPETTVKMESPFLIIVTSAFVSMLFRQGEYALFWNDGIVLLGFLTIYVYYLYRMASSDMEVVEKLEEVDLFKAFFMVSIGLFGVVVGGDLTVDAVVGVSKALNLSNSLFALTVVAVGTSLPELVTSLTAAGRGHSDLSVGNIVGSNIMNILVILGLSSIFGGRLSVDVGMYYVDLSFVLGLSVLFFILALKGRFRRLEGAIFLVLYGLYLWFVLWRR